MDELVSHLRRSRLRAFARHALHLDAQPQPEIRSSSDVNISDLLIRDENGVELDARALNAAVLGEGLDLEKRAVTSYSPEQLSSLRSAASVSAAKAHSTSRAAAQAATLHTTLDSSIATVARSTTRTTSNLSRPTAGTQGSTVKAVTSTSSIVAASSAVPSSSSSVTPSTSSTTTSTVRVISSTTTSHSTSSTPTIVTITSNMASSTSSSMSASISGVGNSTADASTTSTSSSSGLSTGGIVGVVLALLAGLVLLGSAIGWLYRKHTSRSYSTKAPWSKIDDNITPFPYNEKPDNDDIYGASAAPVIGSRRALAMARQNAFNTDGSFRAQSEYGSNHARVGAGAGAVEQYSSYPVSTPEYGLDPQGRPYNPHVGRTPMMHTYEQYGGAGRGVQPQTRQLINPYPPQPQPYDNLSPVAMGRPAPPTTRDEIDQAEDFADMPEPHSAGYDDGYMPQTATTMDWTGDMRSAAPAVQMPLPTLAPLSPLMAGFDMQRRSQMMQPPAMYLDENAKDQQKRLYGEVARAAGVDEPKTPHDPALNYSTSSGPDTSLDTSYTTASSFSAPARSLAPQRLPPAPIVMPPQPYVHGRPLSPLTEVPTPMSATITAPPVGVPLPSSSALHEQNPFDHLEPPRGLAPPYSATPSTARSGIPSPAYPPSPGGMSVPGSITDSPRGWTSTPATAQRETRGDDFYDDDDAYGGI
ncbi:hypothetical protein BCR39DRAFT_590177 [Naematelia encephala]|uniref:Uncharacterized protein n=1 Tax=Naematelia encephala TaxID=71784 RepID=A0A1Y2ASP5_9TREE|nr:hypothetical protein BCR39DRAFT_590177 [Naematelia encephala]